MSITIKGSINPGKDKAQIACKNCGNVLISGEGSCFFGKGSSITCSNCGNSYTFENSTKVK